MIKLTFNLIRKFKYFNRRIHFNNEKIKVQYLHNSLTIFPVENVFFENDNEMSIDIIC